MEPKSKFLSFKQLNWQIARLSSLFNNISNDQKMMQRHLKALRLLKRTKARWRLKLNTTKNLRQVGAWTEPLPVFMSLSKGLESDNEHGNAQRQDSNSMPHLRQPPHSLYFLLMSFESGNRDTLHIGIFPKMVTTAKYANYFLDQAHQD